MRQNYKDECKKGFSNIILSYTFFLKDTLSMVALFIRIEPNPGRVLAGSMLLYNV